MNALPSNIDVAKARLPATYEQAKVALASCDKIDECQTWANKAEALATYAKMADDDSLRQMADKIQARAVRRMGELLKQFDAQGRRTDQQLSEGTHTKLSQREVAENAGISKHQQVQAVRVANVPADKFDAAIESVNPATVTQLAEMGKQVRAVPPEYVKRLDRFRRSIFVIATACDGVDEKVTLPQHLSTDEAAIVAEDVKLLRKSAAAVRRLIRKIEGLLAEAATIDPPTETKTKAEATAPPTVPEQEPSGSLEWGGMIPCGSSPDDNHRNHGVAGPGGQSYIAMAVRNGRDGTFKHYAVSFFIDNKKGGEPKYLGNAKSLEKAQKIAQQHADTLKAEAAG